MLPPCSKSQNRRDLSGMNLRLVITPLGGSKWLLLFKVPLATGDAELVSLYLSRDQAVEMWQLYDLYLHPYNCPVEYTRGQASEVLIDPVEERRALNTMRQQYQKRLATGG
jgi:hypothetical protein